MDNPASAGLVLYLGPLQSKNNSDCHQSVFYIKNSTFLYKLNNRTIQIKAH